MNREYGIDILRIVSTVGVVILHVFGIFYLKSSAYSGGDCLKTKEFTIRNRHSKIPIWDT